MVDYDIRNFHPHPANMMRCSREGCDNLFDIKPGKKYCSDKCRKKANGKVHDRKRMPQQIEKGKMFRADHPTYDRDRMRKYRELQGPGYSHMLKSLEDAMQPIDIEVKDAICVAGDVHVPFQDENLTQDMLRICEESGVKILFIPGDFMDADAYSKWPSLPGVGSTFKNELEYAGHILTAFGDTFDKIYISRGNHENRVINCNNARIDMVELMKMCNAPSNVQVTNDTFMKFTIDGHEWMCSHPDQFWQTPGRLSVALAEKYEVNHICAHGHFFGEYRTRSGNLYALDGGGLFDSRAMAYQRRVKTLSKTQNGFWIIDSDGPKGFTRGAWK